MGPVKTCTAGCSWAARVSACSQPGRTSTSSSTNTTQLAVGVGDAGVAGGVQPEASVVGEVARAEALGGRADRGGGRIVVDDEHLGPGGGRLGGDRGERDLEVVGALAGGDDDRRGGVRGVQSECFWEEGLGSPPAAGCATL